MKTKCLICGKESEGNERFCKSCGAELIYEKQETNENSDETNNNNEENFLEEKNISDKEYPETKQEMDLKEAQEPSLEKTPESEMSIDDEPEIFYNSETGTYYYGDSEGTLDYNNYIDEVETQNYEAKMQEPEGDVLVNEIFDDEERIEKNAIYPIHTVEKNPYAKLNESDKYFEKEFIDEKEKSLNRPNKRKKHFSLKKLFNKGSKDEIEIVKKNGLKHVHKHVTLILIALIIIALVATFTFNIIEENTINYLNPISNAQGEFSNKIITFSIPSDWQSYNTSQNQTNVIGNFKSDKNGHKILLSVYQSKSSHNDVKDIKRSTEELDIRSGALINSSTNRNINNITGYDVISKNGTNGYEYRTIGFIKDNKEYAFLFVSDDIDSFNNDINFIINSIKYNKNL
ncbi:MAG: hypothetical protein ACI4VU_04300 [Methanobrevibacter sp.]